VAQYTEVRRGQSGAEAQSEELDLRELVEITIRPGRGGGVEVTERFKHHPPERTEFAQNEGKDFLQYIRDCTFADSDEEEQNESENSDATGDY
jgi:hypothetical protein